MNSHPGANNRDVIERVELPRPATERVRRDERSIRLERSSQGQHAPQLLPKLSVGTLGTPPALKGLPPVITAECIANVDIDNRQDGDRVMASDRPLEVRSKGEEVGLLTGLIDRANL